MRNGRREVGQHDNWVMSKPKPIGEAEWYVLTARSGADSSLLFRSARNYLVESDLTRKTREKDACLKWRPVGQIRENEVRPGRVFWID